MFSIMLLAEDGAAVVRVVRLEVFEQLFAPVGLVVLQRHHALHGDAFLQIDRDGR